MVSNQVIVWMIISCVIFAGVLFFSKPIKTLIRIMIQGIIGAAGMFAVNFILAPLDISVGINILTAFIVGVLGIPGFISLYILQVFL